MDLKFLDFEQPIAELEAKIEELRFVGDDSEINIKEEVARLRSKSESLTRSIFAKLSPWQVARVARHESRPYTSDYLDLICPTFQELHGDRMYADDPAIIGGVGRIDGKPLMIIGHQKGRDTKERVRRNYGILIGEATAERIKKEIGSAFPGQEVLEISVKGRNLSEGVPRSFTLNSNEILEALQEPLQGIVGAVKEALEQTPPELGADVAERGIVLTGGGAMLRDIDKLLMEETGLPVVIADDPLTCVARGGGRVIELIDEHGPAVFGLE